MAKTAHASAGGETSPGKLKVALQVVLLSLIALALGGGLGIIMTKTVSERAVERYKAEIEKKEAPSGPYAGDIELRRLDPVVANLAGSSNDWIRIEVAVVFPAGSAEKSVKLMAEYRQDLLGFLRTVNLAQIQGPSGLVHLREDINDRAKIRFKGDIKEIIIESLVVQ